jgi:hypothetical protein
MQLLQVLACHSVDLIEELLEGDDLQFIPGRHSASAQ